MVVVPDSGINPSEDEAIVIGKGVATAIEDFLEISDLDFVFFYCGKGETIKGDKEKDQPFFYSAIDFDVIDTENWKAYAEVSLDTYSEDSLLEVVSDTIGSFPADGWKKVKRHYEPEPSYAMPPIPDLESRRAAKTRTSHAKSEDFYVGEKSYSGNSGVLLFRARRR